MRDRRTKKCKGYGFLRYKRSESAEKALSALDRKGFNGMILNVDWAKDKRSSYKKY